MAVLHYFKLVLICENVLIICLLGIVDLVILTNIATVLFFIDVFLVVAVLFGLLGVVLSPLL